MSDATKYCGLVPRGAPVTRPPLFKMPQKMMGIPCEADRAHGGGVTMMGRTQTDSHASYYHSKQKAEKFDSGLDEMTQYRLVYDSAITPVSCTEDDRGNLSEYVYQPKAKATEAPVPVKVNLQPNLNTKPKTDSRMDISDSAIEMSTNSVSAKKIKAEDSEPKIDSKILYTVHQLFVEDDDGENMLHLSVIFENRLAVRHILKVINMFPVLKCCLNYQNKMKQTALHLAVNLNLSGVVEELLLAGAELDLQDINGNTPFHLVCKKGLVQCMDVFLSIVNSEKLRKIAELTNNEGYNALHLAVTQSNVKVIRRLINIGCDINMQDKKSGLRPLHHALRRRDALRVAKCVVEDCEADVNASTYSGCTALHMAASQGHIDQVAYLIAMGADPFSRTDEGDLPIDYATEPLVVDLLERVAYETTRIY